ncbi:bifunctional adenosylcobinamide kinase/adenosylcobinamide-phosphate guanylyltransferase [Tetzosporium hominis]|nr:bifunctional adenosylcobinamide kinase/adenosylcobinamide-phosphate guanylyltransferase [Tetzosporium hominis]
MHIVLGGAHNGKRAMVREHLARNGLTSTWLSDSIENWYRQTDVLVIDSIPQALFPMTREQRINWLETYILPTSNVIWIIEDVSRGIVPMEKHKRSYRDESGRITQLLVEKATSVAQVWYGLVEMRKGESLWE